MPITIASLPTTQKHFDWAVKYCLCVCCGTVCRLFFFLKGESTCKVLSMFLLGLLCGPIPHWGQQGLIMMMMLLFSHNLFSGYSPGMYTLNKGHYTMDVLVRYMYIQGSKLGKSPKAITCNLRN